QPRLQLRVRPRREPLQLPARRGREAVPGRRQSHQADGQPHREVRDRHPPRDEPAGPERSPSIGRADLQYRSEAWHRHVSARLPFNPDRPRGPAGGALGLATFLLGDVTHFGRYTSPFTDAGERQWRHFYYAHDTWRATQRVTLNYGLRLDVINPQTVSDDGRGGFTLASVSDGSVQIPSPRIRVAGVAVVRLNGGVQNSMNWAPRVGIAYQLNERTVIRGGYGRSYDIGVFGSLFGHTVTQNLPVLSAQDLSGANNFDAVFTLAQAPPAPTFPAPNANGTIPLPSGIFARVLPDKQRLPTVDTHNQHVQRELGPLMSFEVAYVGNHSPRMFAGDNPDDNPNQPTLVGFPHVPRDPLRACFVPSGWAPGRA